MADIQRYLTDVKTAIYGEEVRGSIHDALKAINTEATNAANSALSEKDSAKAYAEQAAQSAQNASNSLSTVNESIEDLHEYVDLAKEEVGEKVIECRNIRDEIVQIAEQVSKMAFNEFEVYDSLKDSNGDVITDSNGDPIGTRIIFLIK